MQHLTEQIIWVPEILKAYVPLLKLTLESFAIVFVSGLCTLSLMVVEDAAFRKKVNPIVKKIIFVQVLHRKCY